MRLILASASPRRAELLRAAGIDFDVVTTNVDESMRAGETPAQYVRRLAADKSAAAAKAASTVVSGFSRTGGIVLGADTTVVVDDEVLAKPVDDEDAARMLRRLSGRTHEVLTGISLRRGAFELGRVETTRVEFAPLSDAEVAWYVATGEGRDKAGAYAIQGLASKFVERIEGCYFNVVGLPVPLVYRMLREHGVSVAGG